MNTIEIEINNEKYFLDFKDNKLFDKNNIRVKPEKVLLRSYVIQENIEWQKSDTNQDLIRAIKKHFKNNNKINNYDYAVMDDSNIGKVIISNGSVKTEHFVPHSKKHQTEITSFIKNVEHLVEPCEVIPINRSLFIPKNNYNAFIKKNVADKPGVYIWYDSKNQEVIYIGMAGKIKTNGTLTNHPISERLQASRSIDITTEKHITTNKYIPAVLEIFEVHEIEFHILPCKENEPAAYVESILLYNYFKSHGVLPILNNAF